MSTDRMQEKHWKIYIDWVAGLFFLLFLRSLFLLNHSPEYLVDDNQYIFTAKPGMIALLWAVAILCGMLIPFSIYKLVQSINLKDSLAGNLFQVFIGVVVICVLSVCLVSINSLEKIRVIVGPESFSYKDADYDFSVSWDIDNISAHYMPWYSTGEYTDEYSWIDFCTNAYSFHVPLEYVGGVDKLINQSYQYWKDYNS